MSDRTAFLTYGSPLTRLYGGFFPAYFGPAARDRLGSFVGGTPGRPGTADRSTWRWRNLHRPSDPIGGPIFCAAPPVFPRDTATGPDPGDVDRPLVDPVFARPPGDPCDPPVLGHSNYLVDPVFAATARALQAGLPHSDVEV